MENGDDLQKLRTQIDALDQNIITTIAERVALVEEIGRYKKAQNLSALDEGRRDALLKTWIETGRALSLPEEFIRTIFSAIHEHSVAVEKKLKG